MQDEDKPIDRDAWRRLLQPGAGEPPRATDERIRAGARRALTPHTGRWWLPASLAASLLLAVLLVQWQYEEIRAPALVSESDVAPEPSREAAPAAMPAEALESAAEASTRTAPAAARRPAVAAPAYQAPAPAADLPAMRKAAEAPTPAADAAVTAGVAQRDELRAREVVAGEPATPEEWLARIEALRAAGRVEEAEAELKRLETAFPGWLERHHGESR